VADIDLVLYYWIQNQVSYTHTEAAKPLEYFTDGMEANLQAMAYVRSLPVAPARSYYGVRMLLRLARQAGYGGDAALGLYRQRLADATAYLKPAQMLVCKALYALRSSETEVYKRTVYRRP